MLLVSLTAAFVIVLSIAVVVVLEIGDRRSMRRELQRLDGVTRELFNETGEIFEELRGSPRAVSPLSKDPGGHVWQHWLDLGDISTLPDEALQLLVQAGRCCNLRTLAGSDHPVCVKCWHSAFCSSLVPHETAVAVPCVTWGPSPSPVGEDDEDDEGDEALEESLANDEN